MIFSSLIKQLKSLKLTLYLFLCLGTLFFLGVIIPQKKLVGMDLYLTWKADNPLLVRSLEFLGLTDIYTSTLTYVLWGVFFLNLIVVMSYRIPTIWKRTFSGFSGKNLHSLQNDRTYSAIEGRNLENASGVVRKKGYRFFSEGTSFRAVKNRFSPLATILFHLSFLLFLAGGVLTFYTKFSGFVGIAAGETFNGSYGTVRPPKIGNIPRTTFTVNEIIPTYFKMNVPLDLKVVIETKNGKKTIGINKPYKEGSLSFVIKNIDIAPLFTIEDIEGREIDGVYVKLNGLNGGGDSFNMMGYRFDTIFLTNYSEAISGKSHGKSSNLPQALKQSPMGAEKRWQQLEVTNPAFRIDVIKDTMVIKEKTIRMGESVAFDNYKLYFRDLQYWVKFYAVSEYGRNVVYSGFILMVIALIIRFVFYRRDIYGMVENGILHMSGRGEFYKVLFNDEFDSIANEIKSY